jgi:hypothetical protein
MAAIEYFKLIDKYDPTRPLPYGGARGSARVIGAFLGDLISDNEYPVEWNDEYRKWHRKSIRK